MIVVLCKEHGEFRERLFSPESYHSGAADKFTGTIKWLEKMYKGVAINEPLTKDASNGT